MSKAADQFKFGLVVFFGRNIEEYAAMFNLELASMQGLRVLDCPAGPAAFAKQASDLGVQVVACDPLYEQEDALVLRGIVDHDCEQVARKQALNPTLFHPELPHASLRREAMEIFLADYPQGRPAGRYQPAQLPVLPFADQSFDLVLSANLLFIYSDIASGGMMEGSPFDYQFHKQALLELIRVSSREARIYPLRGPGEGRHQYLQPLMQDLAARGLKVRVESVRQRDIIGAEQMLVIGR